MLNCGSCCPDSSLSKSERKRKDRYVNLVRELKKLRNVKVTMIPIVIDAFDRVSKLLVQGMEDAEIRDRWRPSKLFHY